jgi:formylglycine-generating enzyme required for sulfatase activity
MIYRCWPTLLALAGKLQVPADRAWFEREVTAATTALQAEIWKQVAGDLDWQPTVAEAPGTTEIARQAWVVLAQFLVDYPRLALARANSREIQIARDFETWFRPIPKDPEESRAFPMSAEGERGSRRLTTSKANLKRPFHLAQYPTTNAVYHLFDPGHWRRFSTYLQDTDKDRSAPNSPEPQCPVQRTTWYDAWCACTWLHCRLPTEHEWEYACRAAPSQPPRPFWFGNESQATAQYLWCYTTRSESRVDTVGGRPGARRHANAWGLYDMHGNVWEWTASWFFDHAEAGREDSARARSRVLRGGSFDNSPVNCRATVRSHWHPTDLIIINFGFRAARACSPR